MKWQQAVDVISKHMHSAIEVRDFEAAKSCSSLITEILEDVDSSEKSYKLSLPQLHTGVVYY